MDPYRERPLGIQAVVVLLYSKNILLLGQSTDQGTSQNFTLRKITSFCALIIRKCII